MVLRLVISFLGVAGVIVYNSSVMGGTMVYRFVDENSVVHFTDAPTDSRFKKANESYSPTFRLEKGKAFLNEIYLASNAYNVEPALVTAVMMVESDFKERALSPKGAVGLMQLLPTTAERYRVTDVYNPSQNVWAGVRHLKYLLSLYGGNVVLALAAYNAGEESVRKYGGIPPYLETRQYIQRVLRSYSSMR